MSGGQLFPEVEDPVKFFNSRLFVEGGRVLVTVEGFGLGDLPSSAPTFPAVSALGDPIALWSAGLVVGSWIVQLY